MGRADYYQGGNWNAICLNKKQCTKCNLIKLLDEFYKNPNGHKGVFGRCIECHNIRAKELRILKGKEFHAKRAKIYLTNNPEARKKSQKRNQEWRKNNLAYDAFRASMRRELIKRATPKWTNIEEIKFIYEKASFYGFQVDHIVPIKSDLVCGLNIPNNMQLLHKDINSSKGNRYWPDMPERNV